MKCPSFGSNKITKQLTIKTWANPSKSDNDVM
jgi:hypothetical protein